MPPAPISIPPEPRVPPTPAPVAPPGPPATEVVALPPFEFDAVEPPWVRDTRTANTAIVLPKDEMFCPLVDALRALPGVQIGQPGGPGGRSSLYLRGGEDNYTEVLLDGVPVNNSTESTGGGFDFGTLDASEFAAVAVVPGPVSARYGPDALSGVIKLTSLVMGVPDSRVAMQVGGQGLAAAHLSAGAQSEPLTAMVAANWSQDGSRSEGNFARHEAIALGATWRGRSACAARPRPCSTASSSPGRAGSPRPRPHPRPPPRSWQAPAAAGHGA